MKELTLQEAALAWAQGKSLEATAENLKDWTPITGIGYKTAIGKYSSWVFSKSGFRFRLAPEPPAKRFRPWTPEEVPVGALVRHCDWVVGEKFAIIGFWSGCVLWMTVSGLAERQVEKLVDDGWLFSIDHGKTWLPCGVEVES